MNQHPGTLGRKLGMTQLFNADGSVDRVTVIECTAVVTGKRTLEKDGYSALILGIGERKEKHTNKPLLGAFKKANITPKREIKEFRLPAEEVAKYEVGQKVGIDQIFEVGQFVDVQGFSRGRGFAGVMKRHKFKGQVTTHGTHEYKRHGGAIGTNMTPGRTLPGMKMPGHMGDVQKTVLNLKVVRILADKDLLLVSGGVPGSRNQTVIVRGAIKKMGGKKKA